MCQVSTVVVDGKFKLFESQAILIYICCAFPGVASHWYPNDPFQRSKIHSVLDWHHSNLRQSSGDNISRLFLLSEKDYDRILKPYKKVVQWIEDTKRATAPHFDEVHGILFKVQKRLRKRMAVNYNDLKSKL
ncbi:putative glutathione transferase [Helianthus annuus]|uniref:Glutathione transferase n=1 Tax=Helianthus annuus TaxID=4232 RepID=A0A9K3HAP3_HELAN|nr:putative glutathione transferase [Helianthus annuus]KAJ0476026.1 putative glutathione transferase [Helianthus annuus]KAJ0496830.1 putative glutathione transferase [Helianthus annuus]KAJ0848235.1 putative glutathione transferase [Helianthus annuus]